MVLSVPSDSFRIITPFYGLLNPRINGEYPSEPHMQGKSPPHRPTIWTADEEPANLDAADRGIGNSRKGATNDLELVVWSITSCHYQLLGHHTAVFQRASFARTPRLDHPANSPVLQSISHYQLTIRFNRDEMHPPAILELLPRSVPKSCLP